uniref:Uncharacterized protein n=1 Tax=Rhizophora mucronata TaxID=61149 RepID=A0A2P2QV79_RHIMU
MAERINKEHTQVRRPLTQITKIFSASKRL